MDREQLVAHCLAKPGAEEPTPGGRPSWWPRSAVRRSPSSTWTAARWASSAAGTPEEAAEWRERYPGAIDMSHYIGRYGWNSVDCTGKVPDDDLRELIDSSYEAIVAALPKGKRPAPG